MAGVRHEAFAGRPVAMHAMRGISAHSNGFHTCRALHLLRGFLLNHIIPELLPEQKGYRQANADPVTGQAAWYDLRVRVEKAESGEACCGPRFPSLRAGEPA